MKLNDILSTEKRCRLINYILDNPEHEPAVEELSRTLKLSKGFVSQYLKLLEENKILKKNKKYRVNLENPLTKGLKILLNLERIEVKKFKKIPSLLGVGLYGSWANGTNKKDSDVDFWVKVKKYPPEEVLARVAAELRKKLGRVQILILQPERIENMRKNDPIFYHSLVFGSIVLLGEGLEV
jgi:predicted nucleotidyltransferase